MSFKIVFLAAFFIIHFQTFALDKSMFDFDKDLFYASIEQLDELENFITSNPDYNIENILTKFNSLTLNTRLNSALFQEEPCNPKIDAGNFILGFCCGLPGIAIVYLTSSEIDNFPRGKCDGPLRSSLYGYIARNVAIIASYIAYFAVMIYLFGGL